MYSILHANLFSGLQQNMGLAIGCMLLAGIAVGAHAFSTQKKRPIFFTLVIASLPLILLLAVQGSVAVGLTLISSKSFVTLPLSLIYRVNTVYGMVAACLLGMAYRLRKHSGFSLTYLLRLSRLTSGGAALLLLGQALIGLCNAALHRFQGISLQAILLPCLPFLILILLANGLKRWLKHQQFDEGSQDTTGQLGSAMWMRLQDFEKHGFYCSATGPFIGVDAEGHPLYVPLVNKLTISPPGGGKTSASSIPVLLSHDGPVFVFDIKGELWAVTARYRFEHFKRKVIVIDPYRVTQGEEFKQNKPAPLLETFTLNPFDWIPEEKGCRDRMINAFAASFIIQEGAFAAHFDENAKILIRGYIDYIMTLPPPQRHLGTLYRLLSESSEEAALTFEQMAGQGGRAGAAAHQISRVGEDERGSILSTSYRQIDWMSDSNIQATLSSSNVDLREFIRGDLDIFVVLPEDQVKDQSRLVRMLLALLMGMLVQASPSDLSKKKSLFLLEELAQLGYCPDVEQCIEVLRARGVVVWTVFQTLSQIEQFKKPDLFKGAPLKQIFTTDDVQTMQWIQTLGGKKTILTKTRNSHHSHSEQKNHVFRGTSSQGEGESVQETGVDLIPLNEIREMPIDGQLIFLHGAQPIRCKKVRYFEHPEFEGKFDPNPLEAG